MSTPDAASVERFLALACLTYEGWHRSNPAKALRLLADDPRLARASVYTAAAAGDVEHVRAELDRDPALVNAKGGPLHWEPLLYACYSRLEPADASRSTLDVARLLLARGADPNAGFLLADSYAFTALTGAFGRGEDWSNQPPHPECMALATLLLEAGADPNDSQTLYNRHFERDDEHLKLLFKYGLGLSPDQRSKGKGQRSGDHSWLDHLSGESSAPEPMLVQQLCWAALHGFPDRVRLLVEHGVDVNTASERSGHTPYEEALRARQDTIADYLLEHGAKKVALDPVETFALACIAGRREEARARLAADPTLLERLGHQGRVEMLHRAVEAKEHEGIRLILELGVDINAMVPGGGLDRSVLHNAAGWGGVAMVTFLLDLGADRQLRDLAYHSTPIGWAFHGQQRDVVDYLLPFATIFDAARCDGVERVAELLRDDPSLANARDEDGDPLIFYLHPELTHLDEITRLLVAHGANLGAPNRHGKTLLDVALARGWTDFADIIRRHVRR